MIQFLYLYHLKRVKTKTSQQTRPDTELHLQKSWKIQIILLNYHLPPMVGDYVILFCHVTTSLGSNFPTAGRKTIWCQYSVIRVDRLIGSAGGSLSQESMMEARKCLEERGSNTFVHALKANGTECLNFQYARKRSHWLFWAPMLDLLAFPVFPLCMDISVFPQSIFF